MKYSKQQAFHSHSYFILHISAHSKCCLRLISSLVLFLCLIQIIFEVSKTAKIFFEKNTRKRRDFHQLNASCIYICRNFFTQKLKMKYLRKKFIIPTKHSKVFLCCKEMHFHGPCSNKIKMHVNYHLINHLKPNLEYSHTHTHQSAHSVLHVVCSSERLSALF